MTSIPPTDIYAGIERREFHRRKLQEVLEIEWGSSTLTGIVRDISPQGLFVELMPPLWLGATFSARLMLNPILPLNCTVRRVEPGKGNAVTFDLPEESGMEQLKMLLATLPKP
ncbi:MAG: PilZ domain-containing protein [Acidobacteriia bacterium]|nr:PilZ domain-containing protein [Terriglobia bacterium]